jgi:capsular polysaccharide biosynthesis protein
MLQRQPSQDAGPIHEQNQDQTFSISYVFDILKRRALYFVIPFLTILTIGSLVTIGWPAKYLSEGKILISSQEIPTDLVRPTVSTLANERIQYIQQRIMTRDNVVALAKKFNLSMGWQGRVSGSEMTDFIRERTKIKPLEGTLGERKQAIAFSVGFEYERPDVATRVANELVTMILNEDVRTRTNFASETTKFLENDVKRLEIQLSAINDEINNRQKTAAGGLYDPADDGRNLAALKAQLAVKSANFSDSHPDVRALKRQIKALEDASSTTQKATPPAEPAGKDVVAGNPNPLGMDTLLTQRTGLRTELNTATQKLAAARLGESLERGQHSERLEVIEQATLPTKPTSPNRPKIFAIVVALALMAGGGLMVGTEMLNPAIRQSADLLAFVDGQLLVSIPVIQTNADVRRKKNRRMYMWAALIAITLVGLITIFFILPPLDLVFDKIMRIILR